MVKEKNMLNKDTVKKIAKIQELLANKKDGVLVAHYGAVDPSDMEFNALVVNKEGAFVTYTWDNYDDYRYEMLVNVDKVTSIYLQKQVKEKLL